MRVAALMLAVSMVAGCQELKVEAPMGDDAAIKRDLESLATARVFFGHQSVGMDIIEGVRDLASKTGVTGITVVQIGKDSLPDGPYLAHTFVGENDKPDRKCDDFGTTVKDLSAKGLDVAVLKFCYADIRNTRNIAEMFDYYKQTLASLEREFPSVAFVHTTVPVTMRSVWWKRTARAVLGKEDPWDVGSTNRYEYNERVLAEYRGAPLIDIARIESTRPDGSRATFEYRGKPAFELLEELTYDGGHLNEVGRQVVAREFIRVLADVVRNRGVGR